MKFFRKVKYYLDQKNSCQLKQFLSLRAMQLIHKFIVYFQILSDVVLTDVRQKPRDSKMPEGYGTNDILQSIYTKYEV